MKFGEVDVNDCPIGSVLGHSQRIGSRRLPKGTPLTSRHLQQLRDAGVERVTVAVLGPDDIDEDTTADRLARALAGSGVSLSRALTGRCNLHAALRGLVEIDVDGLVSLNRTDWRLTVATVPQHTLVEPGDLLATVKVIPFAVDEATLSAAETQATEAGPILRVARLRPRSAALVLSGESEDRPGLRQRTISAQRERLRGLGCAVDRIEQCAHQIDSVADALDRCLAAGHDPILFIGASAVVDAADVFPAAVERVGGVVDHIGMPVDPGNLLVVAHQGDVGLFGVPGCARTSRPSGFDAVLRAYIADVPMSPQQIMGLGLGGLLKAASGPAPRPRRPQEARGVAAIVLAAGQGARMGGTPKVLRRLKTGAPPLVRQVVDRLQQAQVSPIVVVTGHSAPGVRAALSGSSARIAHNIAPQKGMGSSLAVGARSIDGVDAALIVLADMPGIDCSVVRALVAAWRGGGHTIVAPVHQGRLGHPVLFDAVHLDALRACSGDVGARALLESHPVHRVEVDSAGVLFDLDTVADLREHQQTGDEHA